VRVLWVSHIVPYPPAAGVLLRAYNLIRAIGAQHELTLVAFIQDIWLKTCYGNVERGLDECRRELERHCVSVIFLPIERLRRPAGKIRTALESLMTTGGYMQGWLQGPAARSQFRSLEDEHFDLVHFDTISLAPFARYFENIPATLGHHNIESHLLLRRAEKEPNMLKKFYFWREGCRLRQYESEVCAGFALNITCSDLDSERLLRLAPAAKVRVVPNGVDCDFFQPRGVACDPKSLVFVGTMNWYPNVDAMLFFLREVWPRVKSLRPELTMDIAGANPPRAILALAGSLADVRVHGFVPDIRPMVEAAALFVCPIRDGGGTKLKILDAFAMQKCVVAHPVACEGIEVAADINVVFARDPDEWVRHIDALLDDAVRRAAIGAAARRLAKSRYSFDAIGRGLADVFTQLAAQDKASPSASI
jgi:glycosyltransferase involved in cell wall biosynthesis